MKKEVLWLRMSCWVGAIAEGVATFRMLFPRPAYWTEYRYALGWPPKRKRRALSRSRVNLSFTTIDRHGTTVHYAEHKRYEYERCEAR